MKSQKLMDLYSDYLLSSPSAVSALVLVKVLNDSYSHDSITRMLAQPELSQRNFWKGIKSVIRKIESEQAVISIDDTLEHKPHSSENELIAWHWGHSKNVSVCFSERYSNGHLYLCARSIRSREGSTSSCLGFGS